MARTLSTQLFISGEQLVCPPAPSSPPPCSQDKQLRPDRARRILEQKLGLQIPRATFYRWLANGILPATKLVNRYFIRASALDRFADEADWKEPEAA